VVFYQVCSGRFVSDELVVKGQLEKPIIFFCLDSQGFNGWPRFCYRNLCVLYAQLQTGQKSKSYHQ
jgi:hypothetical protein